MAQLAVNNEALISAYIGYYDFDRDEAIEKIKSDSQRDRLETYLEWEGIIGYTDTIMRIVTST